MPVVYVLPAKPAPVLLACFNPIIPLRGSPRFRDRGAPWSIGSARRARRANVGHQLRLIQTWRCPILFKPPSPEIPIRSRVLERAPRDRKRRNTLVLIFLDTACLGSLRLRLRRRRRVLRQQRGGRVLPAGRLRRGRSSYSYSPSPLPSCLLLLFLPLPSPFSLPAPADASAAAESAAASAAAAARPARPRRGPLAPARGSFAPRPVDRQQMVSPMRALHSKK